MQKLGESRQLSVCIVKPITEKSNYFDRNYVDLVNYSYCGLFCWNCWTLWLVFPVIVVMQCSSPSFGHCLKKHWRLLYSEVTSKTQVQTTSFTKYSQVPGHDHGWLLRFLQNTVTRFNRASRRLIRLLLIIFDHFNSKMSGNAVESKWQTDNSRWLTMQIKTSFRKS